MKSQIEMFHELHSSSHTFFAVKIKDNVLAGTCDTHRGGEVGKTWKREATW
jgi:hypothetical protein